MKRKLGIVLSLLTFSGALVQDASAYFNVYSYSGEFLYTTNPNNNPEYEGDHFVPPYEWDDTWKDPYAN